MLEAKEKANPKHWSEIDWNAQWSARDGYRDGFISINLERYKKQTTSKTFPSVIKLAPGPGFGDFSHPTTRLVLSLMPQYIQNKSVIDVGCGSGILSIAAMAMGATSVCGIDIDPQALDHSRANAKVNEMPNIKFYLPGNLTGISSNSAVLMNMIQSEQAIAWQSIAHCSQSVSIIVSSGILSEGREAYLKQCSELGWTLLQEKEEEGWLGFVFKLQ